MTFESISRTATEGFKTKPSRRDVFQKEMTSKQKYYTMVQRVLGDDNFISQDRTSSENWGTISRGS